MSCPPPPPTPPFFVVQSNNAHPSNPNPIMCNNISYSSENISPLNNSYNVTFNPPSYAYSSASAASPTSGMAALDLGPGTPGANTQDQAGWIGWFKGTVSSVGSKVAEKAKTSMDTMITTLDPQMKEFIRKFFWKFVLLMFIFHMENFLKN